MEGTENTEDSLHLLSSGAHCTEQGHFSASPAQLLKPGTDVVSRNKVCKNYADKFFTCSCTTDRELSEIKSLSEFGQFFH